jgi:hypothetical protein
VVDSVNGFDVPEPAVVPVIVIVYVPRVTNSGAAMVNVVLLAELVGLNVPVTPAGSPVALKLTAPLNPFAATTVMTSLARDSGERVNFEAAGERLNLGPAVITSVTVVVAVVTPEVPVIFNI